VTFIPIEHVVGLLERGKQGKQTGQVSTLRPCPLCRMTPGLADVPSNMGPSVPNCAVCKGTGLVDMAHTCVCGYPALFVKEAVVYCGKESCYTVAKHRRTGFGC
jgi:hypothetical protein